MGSIGLSAHIRFCTRVWSRLVGCGRMSANSSFWIWSDFKASGPGCSSLYGDLTQRGSVVEFIGWNRHRTPCSPAALGHIQCLLAVPGT